MNPRLRTLLLCLLSFAAGALLVRRLQPADIVMALREPQTIVLSDTLRQALDAAHATDRWIDDEVLFREGLRRGYMLDDLIVRHEVQRRMQEAIEQAHPFAAPDDATLSAFLQRHADRYIRAARWSFDHLYLSKGARADRLAADADALRAQLAAAPARWQGRGDPFASGEKIRGATAGQIANDFGGAFTQQLATLPAGVWQGPLASPLGLHFVRITAHQPQRPLTPDEARARVAIDYREQSRQDTLQAVLRELRRRYAVVSGRGAPAPRLPSAYEELP